MKLLKEDIVCLGRKESEREGEGGREKGKVKSMEQM